MLLKITIWLLWTLSVGQPRDVDSFLFEGQCKQAIEAYEQMRAQAYAQTKNEELKDISFIGCVPAEVFAPQTVSK